MKGSYNYRELSKNLSTSGAVTKEDLLQLRENGYEVVINLLPDSNEYAIPDEGQIIKDQGLSYHHIPVVFSAPTNDDYAQFVSAMKTVENRKTHVHCAANWRVSAFYSVYAVQHGIWTVSVAEDHIMSLWSPGDYPAWRAFLSKRGLHIQN